MKLRVWPFSFACGITLGLGVLLLTFWFLILGHEGTTLAKLDNVYLGYSVTWFGAFIGLLWGFLDGFIGGAILSALYNAFVCDKGNKKSDEEA
jgi:hypothetical protein